MSYDLWETYTYWYLFLSFAAVVAGEATDLLIGLKYEGNHCSSWVLMFFPIMSAVYLFPFLSFYSTLYLCHHWYTVYPLSWSLMFILLWSTGFSLLCFLLVVCLFGVIWCSQHVLSVDYWMVETGDSDLNVIAVQASVHLSYDHNLRVQNLSSQVLYNHLVHA